MKTVKEERKKIKNALSDSVDKHESYVMVNILNTSHGGKGSQ